ILNFEKYFPLSKSELKNMTALFLSDGMHKSDEHCPNDLQKIRSSSIQMPLIYFQRQTAA
ncbi:MAG TPA: hypothetical protein VKR53_03490, partial [Puia sp.]|nr:hypothetical protein [Puia sp.]